VSVLDTGFIPEPRMVTVVITTVTTFRVVEGMYEVGTTDERLIELETEAAREDPMPYIAEGEPIVSVFVHKIETRQEESSD
jgi:hypothetical protein